MLQDSTNRSRRVDTYAETMPSYRVTMTLGALVSGVDPSAVLPLAVQAARELAVVEASDVSVVAGSARATVRFTIDSNELALQIGEHVAQVTATCVEVRAVTVLERVGGRWMSL
jgi:hypothetical protein